MTLKVDEAALKALFNDLNGGLAREMERVTEKVVQDTVDHLSNQASPTDQYRRNPANVPRRVTGRLQESIQSTGAALVDGEIAVGIGADLTIAPHAEVLLGRKPPRSGREERDWQFAPDYIANNQ